MLEGRVSPGYIRVLPLTTSQHIRDCHHSLVKAVNGLGNAH